MTTYETEVQSDRFDEKSLDFIAGTLATLGFHLEDRTHDRLEATGPGLRSTKQNPLLGVTRIAVHLGHREARASAELGGVDWMRRFVMWFPLSLGVGLGLLAAGMAVGLGNQPFSTGLFVFGLAQLTVLPWLFIGPFVVRSIRRRTESSIETLLNNAAITN